MRHSAIVVVLWCAMVAALPAHCFSETADSDNAASLIATGDFNHDSVADLVECSRLGSSESGDYFLTIRLGRRDGSFGAALSSQRGGNNPRALAVGDFNRDGNLDVMVGNADGALLEFLGDGHGNLAPARTVAQVGSVASIVAGHYTRDGNLGLVVSDVRSNSAHVLLDSGDGTYHVAWSFELPRRGIEFHLATADFNRDGVADLVITSEDSDDYEVMLGNGNGTFTYAPQLSHLKDPNSYCPT